ncbi:MAG: cell division protein ZapE [Burkholderiaceae bacterium]
MNVRESYDHAVARRGFRPDDAQRVAVERLQRLYDDFVAFKKKRPNALMKALSRTPAPRGVYLWGGVGRGKSFLMDSFYSVVDVRRKTRIHFHEFMRGIHLELDTLKGMSDPLDEVARRIAKKYRLICFDEFHVSDIADAMILHRLLLALFDLGVVFVMTSNYRPDTLYPDGLHRDRMLPAIALIEEHLDILNVDGGTDYRTRMLEQTQIYLTPLGAATDRALRKAFESIAEVGDEDARLTIETRVIKALRRAGGVVWFDFATLCGGPRSQNDYLELANRFHTLILSEVPQMSAALSSEARRFTWLVDVCYDRRVKLIISAAVPAEELYTVGTLVNEFQRTVSRLHEMQSVEYLRSERRAARVDL